MQADALEPSGINSVPAMPDMRALALMPRRKVTKICVVCQQAFEAVRESAQCCKSESCRRDFKQMRKQQSPM